MLQTQKDLSYAQKYEFLTLKALEATTKNCNFLHLLHKKKMASTASEANDGLCFGNLWLLGIYLSDIHAILLCI